MLPHTTANVSGTLGDSAASNLVVFFDRAEQAAVSLVGGKGSNLIALSAAGFPVPPGFVVATEAYRQFLEGIDWLEKNQ